MNCFFFFLVFIVSSSSHRTHKTNQSKMEGYIVRGVNIEIEQFPWLVQVTMHGQTHCGGVVVSDRVILTAAHCITDENKLIDPSTLVVYLGSTYALKGQKRYCCEVYKHEKYDQDSEDSYYFYDLGLILLDVKIKFGRRVKIATILPPNKTFKHEHFTMSIAGWGFTDSYGSPADKLQMTRMRYVSNARCNRSQSGDSSEPMPVPAHMFCLVADKWTSDCYGDSGSGVMWGKNLVGIVATGRDSSCGSETMPSMYTDVTYFRKWIAQNAKKLEAKPIRNCLPQSQIVLDNKNKLKTNKSKMDGHIVRGVDIEIEQFPWLVQISMHKQTFCGGVIVSDRVILTAAHCVTYANMPVEPSLFEIYLGSTHVLKGQKHYCCEIYRHEKYEQYVHDTFYFYDLGLMLLETKIKFGRRVKKATILPPNKTFKHEHFTMAVAGWGFTDSYGSPATSLQMTRMRYVSHARCNRSQTGDGRPMPVPAHMFCMVADKWTSDCAGDSGSGVMWGNYLVGIVCTGRDTSCGSETMPSIYTDVTYYRHWIAKNVKKLEAKPFRKCSPHTVLAYKEDFQKQRKHNEIIHESGNDFYYNWLGLGLMPRM